MPEHFSKYTVYKKQPWSELTELVNFTTILGYRALILGLEVIPHPTKFNF